MPKANIEKASDATINPPHPGDPTSDVTRDGGEPLHKPPMPGYDPKTRKVDEDKAARERDENGVGDRGAAVPGATGRDLNHDGSGGPAQSPYEGDSEQAQAWRDDPMPDDAQGRLDWAQRGTDTEARINAALRAEEARGRSKRTTVVSGLERLRAEHRANENESN